MTSRVLEASINQSPVGQLSEVSGLWSFHYDANWLKAEGHFALSPHLPLQTDPIVDGATHRPVQWFFDNLLPEEGQRALLAKDAKVVDADAFGLLAYYGAESAGALTLLLPGNPEVQQGGLKPLSDQDLSARIKALPHTPLSREATKRMSLAGAQHKLAVVLDQNALFEPIGPQPSTHILKPDHPDPDYPQSVINEWFCMRLADRLRIAVPPVSRRYIPESVYLIERFDRARRNEAWIRLHTIDACQLLNLDRNFKYSQGSIETLSALANACRSPAVARTRLFTWLVFNVLIGNSDAHLKNLSFIVTSDGIQLSPHYDLLSTALYESQAYSKPTWPKETTLAWPILKTERFADVTRTLLIEAGEALGIQKATAGRLLNFQNQRIIATAEELYATVEAAADGVTTPAGELRCLRAIIHAVIKPMVTQLR